MPGWLFLQKQNGAGDLLPGYQGQVISNVYNTMQSRLDGYRQSAGAVFLSMVAAMLTLDAATLASVVQPVFASTNSALVHRAALFVLVVGGVIFLLGLLAARVIHWLGMYFAEMTSIVYKIDQNNEVFTPGKYIEGHALFPQNFQVDEKSTRRFSGRLKSNVARRDGEQLIGWRDPSIRVFYWAATAISIVHLGLGFALYRLLGGITCSG